MMVNGIDVSKWQGTIAWPDVAASGVRFAMIRLGYGTQGRRDARREVPPEYGGALSTGLDVGVYFYGAAVTEEAARRGAVRAFGAFAVPRKGCISHCV